MWPVIKKDVGRCYKFIVRSMEGQTTSFDPKTTWCALLFPAILFVYLFVFVHTWHFFLRAHYFLLFHCFVVFVSFCLHRAGSVTNWDVSRSRRDRQGGGSARHCKGIVTQGTKWYRAVLLPACSESSFLLFFPFLCFVFVAFLGNWLRRVCFIGSLAANLRFLLRLHRSILWRSLRRLSQVNEVTPSIVPFFHFPSLFVLGGFLLAYCWRFSLPFVSFPSSFSHWTIFGLFVDSLLLRTEQICLFWYPISHALNNICLRVSLQRSRWQLACPRVPFATVTKICMNTDTTSCRINLRASRHLRYCRRRKISLFVSRKRARGKNWCTHISLFH